MPKKKRKPLAKLKAQLRLKRRKQIKEGMSKLFKEMNLPRASKSVMRVKTKKQFKAFTSVARGWYKWHGKVGSKKRRKAVALVNKLERAF